MSDIFISYASQDRAHAERLTHALHKQGWSVWWDRVIPAGRDYAAVIEEAIDAARCVVVLWSNESIQSRWVRTEASAGLERDVLVPVRIEAVGKLPLAFRQLQTADLVQWSGDPDETGFQQVVHGVSHVLSCATPLVDELEQRDNDAQLQHASSSRPSVPVAAIAPSVSRLPLHRASTTFSESDELIVPTSRGNLLAVALGSAANVAISMWLWLSGTISAVIAIVPATLFAVGGLYAAWRLVRPTPALVINRDGIFDNASAVGVGLIRWDEIDDLREYQFMSQVLLGVFLRDCSAFLAQQPLWKRWILRVNEYLHTAPVSIPQVTLPITIPELLREIAVRFGR